MTLGAKLSYKLSQDFFDASGDKLSSADASFPDGIPERFHDAVLLFQSAYGVTNRFSLWLDVPLVFRKESATTGISDWGLGDIESGGRYRFLGSKDSPLEVSGQVLAKFGTGDSDVSFVDPTLGKTGDLPLGTGNTDVEVGLESKWHALPTFAMRAGAAYRVRFDALAEYLQTERVMISSTDASVSASLPVGNFKIDWGDEIRSHFGGVGQFGPILLGLDARYFYRRTTDIKAVLITQNGGAIDFTTTPVQLRSTWLFTAVPTIGCALSDAWTLSLEVDWPLFGEVYPTLPLVESLVGQKYSMEIRYVF